MTHKILLNNKELHFTEKDLPCLIHYKEKQGGSQFTITLVADLFSQGSKILFLTAYPYAKDNFLAQTKGMENKRYFVENKRMLSEAHNHQAIVLKSGDENLFLEALNTLPDLSERVVLIKNFEIFDQNILKHSIKLEKIIFSGDTDKSVIRKQIINKKYKTIIAFSRTNADLSIKVPALDKYTGYLEGTNKEGTVKLELKQNL